MAWFTRRRPTPSTSPEAALQAMADALAQPQATPSSVTPHLQAYFTASRGLGADERLRDLVQTLGGRTDAAAAPIAVGAGAMVETGADPEVLVAPVLAGLAGSLENFSVSDHAEPTDDSLALWAMAASAVLQRSESARHRARTNVDLMAALAACDHAACECVLAACLLPHDEPMLVLHPGTRRGWMILVDGVADNFQLHTLLAAALASRAPDGLIQGVPPTPRQVELCSMVEPSEVCEVNSGWFNLLNWPGLPLVGADPTHSMGHWIWNEGRPADILPFEGLRVIVIDRPPYTRAWSAGRLCPAVPATVRVTRTLSPEEYVSWDSRIRAATAH